MFTAEINPSDLHDVLGNIEKVFYNKAVNAAPTELTGKFDFKLPVLDESVNMDMGEPDVSNVKLIDQTNWTSYAKKGDPDISLQIPSLSDKIGELLGNRIGTALENAALKMKFQGYSTTPKKVVGSLLFVSDDELVVVYFPNVEIIATFSKSENDKPAYFNCKVTPIPDSTGADFYIGIRQVEAIADGNAEGSEVTKDQATENE